VRQSTWKRKVAVLSVVLVSSVVGLALVPETRMDSFSRLTGLAPDYPDRAVNDTSVARRPSLNVTELTGPSRAYRSALPGAQLVPDYPDRAVNNTITIRRECYREAVEIFLSKPVTGTGTGRYGLESHCFGESSALTTPHSTVLHILAELGVSGAVPFIVLNFMLLGIAWRVVRVQSGDPISGLACVVAAVWFYILIYDQISANYLTSFRYYLFSGLLISLHPLIKKDNIMVAQASVPSDCA
jgi:O-antigen ligase